MIVPWSELDAVLNRGSLSWAELSTRTDAVVLFGSRAAGEGDAESDWDLLCVGDGESRLTQELDLVWVSREQIHDPNWLGSELANHVARWGVVLSGEAPWMTLPRPSHAAEAKKCRIIRAHVDALETVWERLSVPYRTKHLRKLRRDLQRLEILSRDGVVPPSPILDREWYSVPCRQERWRQLLAVARIDETRQIMTDVGERTS
jgi:hypothetical protein